MTTNTTNTKSAVVHSRCSSPKLKTSPAGGVPCAIGIRTSEIGFAYNVGNTGNGIFATAQLLTTDCNLCQQKHTPTRVIFCRDGFANRPARFYAVRFCRAVRGPCAGAGLQPVPPRGFSMRFCRAVVHAVHPVHSVHAVHSIFCLASPQLKIGCLRTHIEIIPMDRSEPNRR